MTDCTRNCWIFAALMGLLVWLFALGQGGAGLLPGVFLGFVTAWLLGGLLVMLFGQGDVADDGLEFAGTPSIARDGAAVPPPAGTPRRDTTGPTRAEPALQAPAGASTDPRQAVTFEPSSEVTATEKAAGQAPHREPIHTGAPEGASADPRQAATFTYSGGADRAPAARTTGALTDHDPGETAARASADAQPLRQVGALRTTTGNPGLDADVTAGNQGGAETGDAPARDDGGQAGRWDATAATDGYDRRADASHSTDAGRAARARRSGASHDAAPRDIAVHRAAPRDGQGDDLSRILGIGQRLTDWLHDNGIWHFDQIAAWTPEDVRAWGERLGRNGGRIERDDWVGQARILAQGGETAHSRRIDRGEST